MTEPIHPTEIDGYKVRFLAEGGMGYVYEARHPNLPTRVIKTIRREGRTTHELKDLERRAGTEAWAASMPHPNIVQVHHKGTDVALGITYIVMDYVNGQDLKQMLVPGQPLPFAQAQDIVLQVLAALAFTHARGIVHRDVKPANVLMPRVGPIKLTDFGAARVMRSAERTGREDEPDDETRFTTGVIGTDRYMAPEQAMGEEAQATADLYAAGTVLYELLTGQTPFAGKGRNLHHSKLHVAPPPPSSLNPQLPAGIDAVVLKALQVDPEARYDSAETFAGALRQVSATKHAAATTTPDTAVAVAAGAAGSHGMPGHDVAHRALGRRATGGKLATWGVMAAMAVALAMLAVRLGPDETDRTDRTDRTDSSDIAFKSCIDTLQAKVGKPAAGNKAATPSNVATGFIGLVTGPESLLYFTMGGDLATVAEPMGLKLQRLITRGTLNNIRVMVSPQNAALGLVQEDVLLYLPFSGDPELVSMVDKLRLVLALYPEEVQVLVTPALAAQAATHGFSVLKNRRIAVASTSEGSKVTASNLMRLLVGDDKPDLRTDQDEYTALCSVAFGKADAMVVTSGAPSPLLSAIDALPADVRARLQLMPITRSPNPVYRSTTLAGGTYRWQPDAVPTLQLRSLLVAYDFPGLKSAYGNGRCADLRRLGEVLRRRLPELQTNRSATFHAKWKEVDGSAAVPGWTTDLCSARQRVN